MVNVRRLLSGTALLLAVLTVAVDYVLHYGLPDSLSLKEGWPYFVAKLASFYIVAALLLAYWPRFWLAGLAYGAGGALVFGAVYYYYPQLSVGIGLSPAPFRVGWGFIHAGCGFIAWGVVMHNIYYIILGVLVIVATVGAMVVLGITAVSGGSLGGLY